MGFVGTAFDGPVISGNKRYADSTPANTGVALLTQSVTLDQNSTNAVSQTIVVPGQSQLVDILVDTTTAWNSGSSATLSVGTTAGGTQYAGSVDVKSAAGRQRPTFSGAQLLAMNNITTNTSVVVTVTPSGATSAGKTIVTLVYAQTTRG